MFDAHCHVGEGVNYRLAPEDLLPQMDELGIDRAVLVPVDRCIAVDNREGNAYLAKAVRQWPDRFWGFAAVNPWFGARAIEELERSVGEGLVGLDLDPILQGFMICDPMVYPLVEAAVKLNVPVYFFTGVPINALPLQLAELALCYPQGRFIMGHMGNTDFWLDVPPALSLAPNIWGEVSPTLASAVNRIAAAGYADRLIFGSDAPINRLDLEVEKIQYWELDDRQMEAALSGNILHLIGQD